VHNFDLSPPLAPLEKMFKEKSNIRILDTQNSDTRNFDISKPGSRKPGLQKSDGLIQLMVSEPLLFVIATLPQRPSVLAVRVRSDEAGLLHGDDKDHTSMSSSSSLFELKFPWPSHQAQVAVAVSRPTMSCREFYYC